MRSRAVRQALTRDGGAAVGEIEGDLRIDGTPTPIEAAQSATVGARRRPSQARSQAKMVRVLRAAARLLDEEGLEAVTTTAVAARAGVSVGWLYNYFDDRAGLLEEIVIAQMGELERELASVHYGIDPRDWRKSAADACDVSWRFFRDTPGLRSLLQSSELSHRVTLASDRFDSAIVQIVVRDLPPFRDDAPDVEPAVVVRTFLMLINQMVLSALRTTEVDGGIMCQEATRASIAYLGLYFR